LKRESAYRASLFKSNPPAADGGVAVYFHDITRRKEVENALRDADRRKDEFLATLAHELRNPLAPIRNAARLLLLKGLPDPQQRWGAEVIHRQADHMGRLLDDLLDVSRISAAGWKCARSGSIWGRSSTAPSRRAVP
jgi:signal transduction histidine kinase